jgi:hypothetical protein
MTQKNTPQVIYRAPTNGAPSRYAAVRDLMGRRTGQRRLYPIGDRATSQSSCTSSGYGRVTQKATSVTYVLNLKCYLCIDWTRFYSVLSPQSSVLIPPGATTSSRNSVLSFASPRGRGQGEGEPNLPIKNPCGRLQRLINHKCSWSAHESPVYRHCFSRQRTVIKWAPKLQDLGSQLSEIIGFAFLKNSRISLSTQAFCTKFTISHKITQRDLHLNPLSTNHLSLNTPYPPPPLQCTNYNGQKPFF